MLMADVIRQDILRVLADTIEALRQGDYDRLIPISNRTIHNAAIYQDDLSLATATLIYALGKVQERAIESGGKPQDLTPALIRLDGLLAQGKDEEFRQAMQQLLADIAKQDEKMHLYVEEVLQKARLKKGSKLHEHGISVAKAAQMLGISQWELLSYVGKTEEHDVLREDARKRLAAAREMFA
jgi:predicted transcriptional regulator